MRKERVSSPAMTTPPFNAEPEATIAEMARRRKRGQVYLTLKRRRVLRTIEENFTTLYAPDGS